MGLDNIPVRLTGRPKDDTTAEDFTHGPKEPCPFAEIGQPLGIFGTCCWLRGKAAEYELQALGRDDLAERMYQDMSASEARAFAKDLDEAADALESAHAGTPTKPRGAAWNGEWDKEKRAWVFSTFSTFEEALAEIRTAARWYHKVADLGCGVHAWY